MIVVRRLFVFTTSSREIQSGFWFWVIWRELRLDSVRVSGRSERHLWFVLSWEGARVVLSDGGVQFAVRELVCDS